MKKVLAMLLACVVTISLTACNGTNASKTMDGTNMPTSKQTETVNNAEADKFVITDKVIKENSPVEYDASKADVVAKTFIRSLASGDYATVISTLNIDESPFVLVEDISFAIPKSKYASIMSCVGREVYLSVNKNDIVKTENGTNVTVSVMCDNKILNNYTVNMTRNSNGDYVVDNDAFYLKDYYISVPGDTKLYIENVEVPETYIEGTCGHSDLKDLYKIPYMGKEVKNLKVVSNNFTYEDKVLPVKTDKNEPFVIVKNIEEKELKEVLDATKDLWNNLYQDYTKNTPLEELKKYFSDNVDTQIYAEIYKGFDNITKGASGYKDINHQITTIEKRKDGECFYITDDVMVLNFQYQVDWVWDFSMGGPESGRRLNHILLQKTADGYKIYEVSAMDFFHDVSGKEW